jgi:hypothetical protein
MVGMPQWRVGTQILFYSSSNRSQTLLTMQTCKAKLTTGVACHQNAAAASAAASGASSASSAVSAASRGGGSAAAAAASAGNEGSISGRWTLCIKLWNCQATASFVSFTDVGYVSL